MLVFGPLAYAAWNRTAREFFLNWALVSAGVAAVIAAAYLADHLRKTPAAGPLRLAPALGGGIFLGLFFYSIGVLLKDVYLFVYLKSFTPLGSIVIFTSAALLAGIALFYARLHVRALYGLTEAMVGLTVAATRFASTTVPGVRDPAFYLATLTAGVYLIVRGLDNVHQGLTRDPKDRVLQKVLGAPSSNKREQ